MKVESIYYSQYDATPQEWKLEECTLGMINLIVGENASGKSKVLNIIGNLGNLLSGSRGVFLSATYRVKFDKEGRKVEYILNCEGSIIVSERLSLNGDTLLSRRADGGGEIYFKKINAR